MASRGAHFQGSNGVFLQQRRAQPVTASQQRAHREYIERQDLRQRDRQLSQEFDTASSQFTEVFGATQDREESRESTLPLRSNINVAAQTYTGPSNVQHQPQTVSPRGLDEMSVKKKGKRPMYGILPDFGTQDSTQTRMAQIEADKAIQESVDQIERVRDLQDPDWIDSQSSKQLPASHRKPEQPRYTAPEDLSTDVSDTIELTPGRFLAAASTKASRKRQAEHPVEEMRPNERRTGPQPAPIAGPSRELTRSDERGPTTQQAAPPTATGPSRAEKKPRTPRKPEPKGSRHRHTGGRRYAKCTDQFKRIRDRHIEACQDAWNAPFEEGVPRELWVRESKNPDQILGPRDWSSIVLDAMRTLALKTLNEPGLAARALRMSQDRRMDLKPSSHEWLCKEDIENAVQFLPQLTGTAEKDPSFVTYAQSGEEDEGEYINEIEDAMEVAAEEEDVEMAGDATTETESPPAQDDLDEYTSPAVEPGAQQQNFRAPTADMHRDMEGSRTLDPEPQLENQGFADRITELSRGASVASTLWEISHLTETQAAELSSKDLEIRYLRSQLEIHIIEGEMRKRRRRS